MPVRSIKRGTVPFDFAVGKSAHLYAPTANIDQNWQFIGYADAVFEPETGLYRVGSLKVHAIERKLTKRIILPQSEHDPPCENQSAPVAYAT